MFHIGLDLAARTCGLAVLDDVGKIVHLCSYTGKEKGYIELQLEVVSWIFVQLTEFLVWDNVLIIEDVYVGKVNVISVIDSARSSGAVIYKYYELTKKYPLIVSALQAREKLSLETSLSKAEYQLYNIDYFGLKDVSSETRSEIGEVGRHWEIKYKQILQEKKGTAFPALKKRLDTEMKELNRLTDNSFKRLSTKVRQETGLDEHQSDSLILARYPS